MTTPPTLPELTNAALQWKLILDAVARFERQTREALDAAMANAGSLKQQGVDVDGVELGTASRSGGKVTGEVYDETALLAWTLDHRPDQVVQALRPGWVAWLKDVAAREGVAYDPGTGEVIPGVRQAAAAPGGLVIRTTPGAKAAVGRMVEQITAEMGPFAIGTNPTNEE